MWPSYCTLCTLEMPLLKQWGFFTSLQWRGFHNHHQAVCWGAVQRTKHFQASGLAPVTTERHEWDYRSGLPSEHFKFQKLEKQKEENQSLKRKLLIFSTVPFSSLYRVFFAAYIPGVFKQVKFQFLPTASAALCSWPPVCFKRKRDHENSVFYIKSLTCNEATWPCQKQAHICSRHYTIFLGLIHKHHSGSMCHCDFWKS